MVLAGLCACGIASPCLRSLFAYVWRSSAFFATNAAVVPSGQAGNARRDRSRQSPALTRYGRDLTEEARRGLLDPVIGRQDVIQRVLQVLLRRTKHNPLLIGEAGVGKTAIVEGIAQLVAAPHPVKGLSGKRLIALDVASVVAGSTYRGEFEERLQALLHDCETAAGSVVLFIDEIHVLVGTGNVEGGLDFANMLKPALARSQLQVIGATTLDEYRQYIETDPALSRRFQPVLVAEPSPAECLQLLAGLAPRYETFHGVTISQQAMQAAVAAAQRYMSERRLPDSAIDLIDEAAAKVRLAAHIVGTASSNPTTSSSEGSSKRHNTAALGGDTARAAGTGRSAVTPQGCSSGMVSDKQASLQPSSAAPAIGQSVVQRMASLLANQQQQRGNTNNKVARTAASRPSGPSQLTMLSDCCSIIENVTGSRETASGQPNASPQRQQRHQDQPFQQPDTAAFVQETMAQMSRAQVPNSQVAVATINPVATSGAGHSAAVRTAAGSSGAQRWSDWITSRGWQGEAEVQRQQLLEWFGASPAKPLKRELGHKQTTHERRRKHAELFGQAAAAVAVAGFGSSQNSSTAMALAADVDLEAVPQQQGRNSISASNSWLKIGLDLTPRSCPHCGALVPASPQQLRLTCHNCGCRFLNIAADKLQLGATVLMDKQQQGSIAGKGQLLQQQQAIWGNNGWTLNANATAISTPGISHRKAAVAVQEPHAGRSAKAIGNPSVVAAGHSASWATGIGGRDSRDSCGSSSSSTPGSNNAGSSYPAGAMSFADVHLASEPTAAAGMPRPVVTGQHLLEVVADATGIPVSLMTGIPGTSSSGSSSGGSLSDMQCASVPGRLFTQAMQQELASIHAALITAVLGQGEAVAAVVAALRLSRLGLHLNQHQQLQLPNQLGGQQEQQQQQTQSNRPLLSLLFVGPNGVGKSLMARVLAEALLPSEPGAVLHLSCGELSERHSISRLVGAPPGYVGYGKGGLLTEAIRRRPHCLVVFDDVERAHPDVTGVLLQAVEEGRLMDSMGHSINLRSATLLFTANTAAPAVLQHPPIAASELPAAAQPTHSATPGFWGSSVSRSTIGKSSSSSSNAQSLQRFSNGAGLEGAELEADESSSAPASPATAPVAGPSAAVAAAVGLTGGTFQPQQAADGPLQAPASTAGATAAAAPRHNIVVELGSRVDDVIQFVPLNSAAIDAMVQEQLQQAVAVAQQQGVLLHVENQAAAWFAQHGFSTATGARPLQQLIRRHVMAPLAAGIMQGADHLPENTPKGDDMQRAVAAAGTAAMHAWAVMVLSACHEGAASPMMQFAMLPLKRPETQGVR